MGSMTGAKRRAIGKPCPYCRRLMASRRYDIANRRATVDHIDPRSSGGRNGAANKLICCGRCNEDKAALTVEQWHADLVACNDLRAPVVAEFIAGRARDQAAPADEISAANGWVGTAEARP